MLQAVLGTAGLIVAFFGGLMLAYSALWSSSANNPVNTEAVSQKAKGLMRWFYKPIQKATNVMIVLYAFIAVLLSGAVTIGLVAAFNGKAVGFPVIGWFVLFGQFFILAIVLFALAMVLGRELLVRIDKFAAGWMNKPRQHVIGWSGVVMFTLGTVLQIGSTWVPMLPQ